MSLIRWLARLFLGRRLPRTQGRLRIAGLHDPVTIRRDEHGIPTIEAESERDAFFGLGFCLGQDRPFQLELLRRVVRGTVCELVGPAALPIDRLSRRIGFHRAAEARLAVLDAEARLILEAYAAGIGAGNTTGLSRVPHEYVFLGGKPSPWSPSDSLGVISLISFTLSSNWGTELARLRIWREDGEEALRALDPAFPGWHRVPFPVGATAGEPLDRLGDDLAHLHRLMGSGGGSNNWVLNGNRTASGRPLLANDPHLNAKIPSPWYLVHLRYPGHAVVGASFVGGPAILSGHNGHAAWGLTAGLVDNTDIFLEQLGPEGKTYRQGNEFRPGVMHEEAIHIKGKASVVERVLETPRGPILTEAVEGIHDAVSMRAVWLDPRPLAGLLQVHRARSFPEFRELLRDWPASSQNMVYADASGTIGWQLVGLAPQRGTGTGAMPLPGWQDETNWLEDLLPYEQMPHAENPPEGYLATANTRPLPEGVGPFLGVDWIDGYRLQAIQDALASRSDWDVKSTQVLQVDQRSLVWQEIRAQVLRLPEQSPRVNLALKLLREWNGELTIESTAASVYEVFLAEMIQRVARAKAPRTWETALGKSLVAMLGYNFLCFRRAGHLVRLLREQPDGWFAHGWDAEMLAALEATVTLLETRAGSDPQKWAWGHLRPLILEHPLGSSRLLAPIFNLAPIPHGGDTDTINQASALPFHPLAPTENIASLRVVIDVGNWSASRFILPAGQSGNPFSPHYADQLPFWQRGEGVPIAWTPEEIKASTRSTLILEP